MFNAFPNKKKLSILWFYRVCGISALAITYVPGQAFALPETCKSDGDKTWTFSIGTTVFELSNYDPIILRSEADNVDPKKRLFPPNPATPIGCRDNPQQLSYLRPKGWPLLQPPIYAGDLRVGLNSLQLMKFPPPDGDDPKGDKVLFWREQSVESCENKKYLKRYGDGTILCTDQTGDGNSKLLCSTDMSEAQWEFIISAKRYSTPFGDNLVVDNGPLGPSATYLLAPDLLLNYSWSIIGCNATIDPALAMRVDQSIISTLQAQEIKNYPWPDQTPINTQK